MLRSAFVLVACVLAVSPAISGPIHDACKTGDAVLVKKLLDADVTLLDAVDDNSWTPLLYAGNGGFLAVCKILIERGAKVDARNREGNTALAGAALNNHLDVVLYLIERGANVNNQGVRKDSWPDNNAETALHFAVRSGNPKIVKALLDAGADPTVQDGYREDAIAYAVKKGQPEIAKIMARKVGVPVPSEPTSRSGRLLTEPSPPVFDELADGCNEALWDFTANGGSLKSVDNGLELRPDASNKSFPGLRLRADSLRTDSDWRLKFTVRYSEISQFGRGWGIGSEADPNLNVFKVHADWTYPARLCAGPTSVQCVRKDGWSEYPGDHVLAKPNDWMTFEVVNTGGTMAISLDGKPLVSLKPPAGSYRLWIGPELTMPFAGSWCRIAVRSLQLQYLKGTEPGWVAAVRDALTKPTQVVTRAPTPFKEMAMVQLISLAGVDAKAESPWQRRGNDTIRVGSRSSRIQANPLTVVEFSRDSDRPDFTPAYFYFVVNGTIAKEQPALSGDKPVFTFEVPSAVGTVSRIQIVGLDAKNARQEILRAEVVAADPAKNPQIALGLNGDKVVLRNLPDKGKGVYLYAGNDFIGKITDPKAFAVDARRIPPGQHEFYVVSTNEFGDLMPACRSLIDIKPRYLVTSPLSEGVFAVEGYDTAMPWTFTRNPDLPVAKTRVYMRGVLIAESDKPTFEVNVPLSDVPSGLAELQVMAETSAGELYAPDSRWFRVSNPFIDRLIIHDERAKRLMELIAGMNALDQKVAYWYERAINEPEYYTYVHQTTIETEQHHRDYYTPDEFCHNSTVTYVETLQVPGRPHEFLAICKAAIVGRAACRLEIGRLQKLLRMFPQARATFAQVCAEVGKDTGTGLAAAQELEELDAKESREKS